MSGTAHRTESQLNEPPGGPFAHRQAQGVLQASAVFVVAAAAYAALALTLVGAPFAFFAGLLALSLITGPRLRRRRGV